MSTIINLIISFLVGLLFGYSVENQQTATNDLNQAPLKIVQQLKNYQPFLQS